MFKRLYNNTNLAQGVWTKTAECTFDSNAGGKNTTITSASVRKANIDNAEQFLMPAYVRYANNLGQILGQYPFFMGEMDMPEQINDNININGRNFMQIRNSSGGHETIYIPTDYWLL